MDELEVLKSVPTEVIKEIYSDTVAETLKEAGKIGVDIVKTIRLVLFPLQYGASLQDRLARRFNESIKRVPVKRRISPVGSIAISIAEKLKFQDEGSVITEMYVSLLARAMDSERVGEAHPAFVQIISQLAPDEALLIEQIAQAHPAAYLRPKGNISEVFLLHERLEKIHDSSMSDTRKNALKNIAVRPEYLSQPSLLYTYIEHLVSLGIVTYTNDPWEAEFNGAKSDKFDFWFIELNGFGKLLRSACLSDCATQ